MCVLDERGKKIDFSLSFRIISTYRCYNVEERPRGFQVRDRARAREREMLTPVKIVIALIYLVAKRIHFKSYARFVVQ